VVFVPDMLVVRMGCNLRPVDGIVPARSKLTCRVLPVIRIFTPLPVKHSFSDVQLAPVNQKGCHLQAGMKPFDLMLEHYVVMDNVRKLSQWLMQPHDATP
jgi:hypothetical protein